MASDLPLRLVVATRETSDGFWENCATGRSLKHYLRLRDVLQLRLYPENSLGLPEVYNREIELARDDPALLVFVHDDVHFCDFWWWCNARLGLRTFRLLGVLGNRVRRPGQASWLTTEELSKENYQNYSGFIGMGDGFPPRKIVFGGVACVEVKLLDGVFLACDSRTLIEHDIRFDERFDFHFYDTDLCRQFEARGLPMGTWTISLIHESVQAIGDPGFMRCFERYLAKWGD